MTKQIAPGATVPDTMRLAETVRRAYQYQLEAKPRLPDEPITYEELPSPSASAAPNDMIVAKVASKPATPPAQGKTRPDHWDDIAGGGPLYHLKRSTRESKAAAGA